MYAHSGCGTLKYYYEAVEINLIETGHYIIISNSTIHTYGFMYEDHFNVFNSKMNLILEDDSNNRNPLFKIIIRLQMNTNYILIVAKSDPNVTEAFSVLVFGPNNVSMNRISESF